MTPFADPLILAPAAFIAGILMFLAPCTLPLVPAYLAFISGVPSSLLSDPRARREVRRRVLRNALFFVIGFSAVFILFGVFAGYIGSTVGQWREVLGRAAGLLLIFFGLTMLGVWRIPLLSGEARAALPRWLTLGRAESSFLIGVLFALGWSPCIGPVLGSVLFLASSTATALSGAALLAIFSFGLAVPFLLTAAFMGEASLFIGTLTRAAWWFEMAGGVVLILIGLLMLTGNMGLLLTWGFAFFNYDALLRYM